MNYEEMEPVVAAICSSITEEPEKWEIKTYDIRHIDRKFNNFDINKKKIHLLLSGVVVGYEFSQMNKQNV